MYTNNQKFYIAHAGELPLFLQGKMANRHGLIAGATGTGKTVTLQVIAESFSQAGVPCFMADVKGDLSGISQPGKVNSFIEKRIQEFNLPSEELTFKGCPTRFFDLFGEQGHPLRTTISAMGPQLLSRLLGLNDTQTGILHIVFEIADKEGLLLIDTKDLRKMLHYVGQNTKQYTTTYGHIAPQSIGAIQRSLLTLEQEGATFFFGEPAFDVFDFIQTQEGQGVINLLAADKLMLSPKLYSTFLLWLLSELYTQLPEVGDQELPKFVFFFDEAHLLFKDTPKVLIEKIEQVVRLIRSKGVGVYFITQSPSDIPDSVLAQLGNRVQHALRAYTPKEKKAINTAAQTFRPNPNFKTEDVISEMGTGEALVSFLDKKGIPGRVERAKLLFPLSAIGPITKEQRAALIKASRLYGRYENYFDRESAYEILSAREETQSKEEQTIQKEKRSAPARKSARQTPFEKAIGSAASSIGRNIGNAIIRTLLGGMKR